MKWMTILTCGVLLAFSPAACNSPDDSSGVGEQIYDENVTGSEEQQVQPQELLCAIACSEPKVCFRDAGTTYYKYHCRTRCGYDYYTSCGGWRGSSYCASQSNC